MPIAIKTNEPKARKRVICIHGPAGVGKTTFACGLGRALLIPTEVGYKDIACDHLELQRSYLELMGTLMELYSMTDLDYDTLVLDSVDWAEILVDKQMDDEGVKRDYGKGVAEMGKRFKRIVDGCVALRDQLNVNVVMIAHSQMKRVELPDGSEFDQWQPKLSKKSNEILIEAVDDIGYAHMETITKKVDGQFRERGVGKHTGRRMVSFVPSAAHVAKNRARQGIEVPESFPLDPSEYSKFFL